MTVTQAELESLLSHIKNLEQRVAELERIEQNDTSGVTPSPTAEGDMVTADSTPDWSLLPIGNANYVLFVNPGGTLPAWTQVTWASLSAGGGSLVHDHEDNAGGGQLSVDALTDYDHGTLSGLGDDDHAQYLLASGARTGASSQRQHFTNEVSMSDGLIVGIDAGTVARGVIESYDGSSYFFLERGGGGGAGSQGLIARTGVNPASGESIFEVRSSGGGVRLFVAHGGTSYFGNDLAIGEGLHVGNTAGTPYTDDVTLDGGLHVNVSGDPVTGEIRASGDVETTAGYFQSSKAKHCQCSMTTTGIAGTNVPFSIRWQEGGFYLSTSNTRCHVPEDGTYRVEVSLWINYVSGAVCTIYLYVGGTLIQELASQDERRMSGSCVKTLSAADYVQLTYQSESSASLYLYGGTYRSQLTITKVN